MDLAFAGALGYVIGSLPVVYLIARARGVNLREAGTGNLGVGNLWAQTDRWIGVTGGVVDFAKGPVAVLLPRVLGFDAGADAAGAVGVVAGQMWPFALGFNGGRGNLTASGCLMALNLWIGLLSWMVVVALTAPKLRSVLGRRTHIARNSSRSTPIASLAGLTTFVVLSAAFGGEGRLAIAVAAAAVTGLILVRRVTAPWPPDPATGRKPSRSFKTALLFDRPPQPSHAAADGHAPLVDGERV